MAPKAAAPTSSRQTRATTGHSSPRVFAKVEEAVAKPTKRKTTTKKTTTKKTTTTKAKANTGKPRTKKSTTGAGVKKAPAKRTTTTKKPKKAATVGTTKAKPAGKPGLIDMVKGAALKIEGAVTGKSGKKVSQYPPRIHRTAIRETCYCDPSSNLLIHRANTARLCTD